MCIILVIETRTVGVRGKEKDMNWIHTHTHTHTHTHIYIYIYIFTYCVTACQNIDSAFFANTCFSNINVTIRDFIIF